MLLCPHCDVQLPERALFCPQCGGAIARGEPAPQVEVAPPAEPPPVEQARSVTPAPAAIYAADLPSHELTTALPVPENIAGVLSYLTLVPAVIFLFVDPFRRSRFVRFHALQHILLCVAGLACAIAASVLWMVLQLIPPMRVLVFPFAGLIGLAWFFLWLLLVVKAYHHEMFKLPWIGAYAEEWSRTQL